MNKRGQFALYGIGLLVVAIIVGFIVWNTKFRYVVLGFALVILSVAILFKADLSRKVKTTLFLIVLGIGLVLIFSSGVLQSIDTTGGYVQAPQFGFIRCDPTGPIIPSGSFSFVGEKIVGCSEVGETTQCTLVVKSPQNSVFSVSRRLSVYDASGTLKYQKEFARATEQDITTISLNGGTRINPVTYKVVWEYPKPFNGWVKSTDQMQYYYNYQPFVIKKYDSFSSSNGQAITSLGKTSCDISIVNGLDIVVSDTIGLEGNKGSPDYLEANEAYTYFTRHVTVPSFSTGTNEAGAYCVSTSTGGTLYKIEEVQTNGATYKIVSPSVSDVIKNVECCNGDSTTTKTCQNNKWVSTQIAQCSLTKPCPNDQFQRDVSDPLGLTAVRYKCVSGTCQPDTKKVECTLDSQCGVGNICVGFECRATCVDCEIKPIVNQSSCTKWYQEEGTVVNYKYSVLGIKFGATEQKVCKLASWITLAEIMAVIVILGGIALYLNKPKRRKK